MGQNARMATASGRFANSADVMTGVTRNVLVSLLIFSAGAFGVFAARKWGTAEAVAKILVDGWIVQAVLVTAVVTLIYRLQSDIASLAGLQSMQRVRLDAMVRRKALRLWGLFFAIALSALLPRLLSAVTVDSVRSVLLELSLFGAIVSALYCLYIPSMWNELRTFLTALVAEREKKDRQTKELERLSAVEKDKAA